MIFVTLGSQKFQFDRLLKKIDELIDEREHLDMDKRNDRIKWSALTDEIHSLMDVKDKLYSLSWKTA